MRMKAKLYSQRLPDAQKAWRTFAHMARDEQIQAALKGAATIG